MNININIFNYCGVLEEELYWARRFEQHTNMVREITQELSELRKQPHP